MKIKKIDFYSLFHTIYCTFLDVIIEVDISYLGCCTPHHRMMMMILKTQNMDQVCSMDLRLVFHRGVPNHLFLK